MELLKQKLDVIPILKNIVKNNNGHYIHTCIQNKEIEDDTISIVMTSHNRSKQFFYTLNTIASSTFKNIHVIVVDDSNIDKICIDQLCNYPFYIDFIEINRDKKCWNNPCINYNIGFEYVKGSKVIIQNSEVCHVGDVLSYVNSSVNNEEYYIFDVRVSTDFSTNECIYDMPVLLYDVFSNDNLYNLEIFDGWYQHHARRNCKYHFLTGMSLNTFKKIKEFSYDYSFGHSYDDDDFLLKIQSLNINMYNVNNNVEKIGGIHLFHDVAYDNDYIDNNQNASILVLKKDNFKNTGKYIEIYDSLMQKTIVTITGIRPDFIRMCNVFKELDKNFKHILIHTGQHYDTNLSDVFFEQLQIRKPDFILNTGKESTNHFEQLSYLSREIPILFKEHNINPDLILFLGDSNSAGIAFPLKKEGYKIGHIEAGMRSYDKRMLEEINRTVCDHCSDILFVYHDDYKEQLKCENTYSYHTICK